MVNLPIISYCLLVSYYPPRCSNDLPIPPADGLCCRRQNHSWCRRDGVSSTWSINEVHTFHRHTRQRCREMYGGPYVLRCHPTPRLRDSLLHSRSEPTINKPQHWLTRNGSLQMSP